MYRCNRCGKEFSKENQKHFCSDPPTTIDQYISLQPDNIQPLLNKVRIQSAMLFQKHRSESHGVCQPIGIDIISFTLQPIKII